MGESQIKSTSTAEVVRSNVNNLVLKIKGKSKFRAYVHVARFFPLESICG